MTKRHMLQIALDGMTDTDMSRRRYDVNGFSHWLKTHDLARSAKHWPRS